MSFCWVSCTFTPRTVCACMCAAQTYCARRSPQSHITSTPAPADQWGHCVVVLQAVSHDCPPVIFGPPSSLAFSFISFFFFLKHQPLPSLLLGGVGMSWWMRSDSMWPKTLLFEVKLFHQWGLLPISPCSSNESQLPSAHWPSHVTQQLYTAVSRMLLILKLILIWHPTTTNNAPELTERKRIQPAFYYLIFY